ncbi:serpin-zx [Phtheirospermum japonicum]|uniref:Serpin-zx n=1 Tax=Phtheirospermum japonicum TaxID=374723 RepID=A0A830D3F3_9LAMI|nr:serpin-zx [Phtheirospermum japonicum]
MGFESPPAKRRDDHKRHGTKLGESIVKQTDFSLSLAKHVISTKAKATNFVFSPLSMHDVLCMVAAGSAGPTRTQFLGYLKSRSVADLNSLSSQIATLLFADGGPLGGPRLSFADGVWVDQTLTLKPAFQEVVQNYYKATSNHVDFRNKVISYFLFFN